MNASLLRTLVLGGTFVAGSIAVALTSLTACESLSQTSPLPPKDASDLDGGGPPPEPEEAEAPPPTPDAGKPPNSARLRVANLIQGGPNLDLCVKVDAAGTAWEPNWITGGFPTFSPSGAENPDGLAFGEVSRNVFVNAAEGAGTKYLLRVVPVGGICDGAGAVIYTNITPSVTLRPNTGVTIFAAGKIAEGVDAGDANPRGTQLPDNTAPPSTATLFRVFHGVPDIAAFDVVVNGETVLTGIKYGNALGFPYTSPNGFASINAGIPEEATMTLRSGTTVRSFTIPERLRRGVASTVFVGGTANDLEVKLCPDRPTTEGTTSKCTKLVAQE